MHALEIPYYLLIALSLYNNQLSYISILTLNKKRQILQIIVFEVKYRICQDLIMISFPIGFMILLYV